MVCAEGTGFCLWAMGSQEELTLPKPILDSVVHFAL